MAKERRDRSKRGEEAVRRREEAERRRGEEHRGEYSGEEGGVRRVRQREEKERRSVKTSGITNDVRWTGTGTGTGTGRSDERRQRRGSSEESGGDKVAEATRGVEEASADVHSEERPRAPQRNRNGERSSGEKVRKSDLNSWGFFLRQSPRKAFSEGHPALRATATRLPCGARSAVA